MIKFLVLLSLFLPFFITLRASAHVLQSDGNIGAVMHIDPDDDPIANQPATFFFEIKDKTNKFDPKNCQCRVDIYENGKVIYSDALYQSTSNNNISAPVFQYTFPKPDVYQVKLIGNPNDPGDFQPFSINYDVRVDRSVSVSPHNTTQQSFWAAHSIQIIVVVLAVVFFIFFAIINDRNQKKQKRKT